MCKKDGPLLWEGEKKCVTARDASVDKGRGGGKLAFCVVGKLRAMEELSLEGVVLRAVFR